MENAILRRFIAQVKPNKKNRCIEWGDRSRKYDYGRIRVDGRANLAHRWLFQYRTGLTLSLKEYVCHKCDNKRCVRLGHLFLGDHTMNIRDAISKGIVNPGCRERTKKVCSNGHAFSKRNTYHYITKHGSKKRICRSCRKMHEQNRRDKLKSIYGTTYKVKLPVR